MLLKRLEIRNMRKIKQAEIEFHGPGTEVIQGANMSGKSTVAQSIALTMNGPKEVTPGMISRGEEQAEIIALTDDGLEIRTIVSEKTEQKVKRYDEKLCRFVSVSGGVRAFLNSICSGLEMPWALRDMTDAKIIELVKNRSGVEETIAAIDADLKEKEAQRTETGREKKRMGEPIKVPETKHPVLPIDGIKAECEKARVYLSWRENTLLQAGDYVRERCHFTNQEQIAALAKEVRELADETAAKFGKGKAYTQTDIDEYDRQIAQWYDVEKKAAEYDRYIKDKKEWDRLTCLYDDFTLEIEDLRAKRKKTLADMKLGVKGLEIGEDNMLYHNGALRGITETNKTGNWSTAESVQVFFGLGARFAGEMKVLVVDNAESLDPKTTGSITSWAEKAGFLVIMLKVAEVPETLEDGIIYLKEGEVLAK
ncbi:MAG: AAA family ATPase [Spirochaetaceae bacterium]|jgi:hypothetical protein|nr:AAA family ATPase [Spirochaetaceae bacterium]